MWIGDVGQPDHCVPGEEHTEPVFTYSPYTGGCSIIGGHVYRCEKFADLVGSTYVHPGRVSRPHAGRRDLGEPDRSNVRTERYACELSAATWRKSSASAGEHECIEVADLAGGVRGVRDSKCPEGPAFVVGPRAWAAFIGDVTAI